MAITEESVRAKLGAVLPPDAIQQVTVNGADVAVTLGSIGPRGEIGSTVRSALATEPGVGAVDVHFSEPLPPRNAGPDDPVPGVKNVVLVMSGKGGVGKSTVATNLAMALLRAGYRVGLLDADIYGPSIPTMLGVTGRPVSRDGKTIEPLERFGMKLMSIGFLVEDAKQAIIWRGPMLHSALNQFLKDMNWGELDFLVLDLPPGTGDVALSLSQGLRITGAVIVTTPQNVATDDVYKSVSLCKRVNINILGVVENMSYFIDTAGVRHELFGKGGGAAVAEFAEAPLLGQLPIDASVREWGDKGTPVVKAAPGSSIALAIMNVAEKLVDVIEERAAAGELHDAGPEIDRTGGTGKKRLPVTK